MTKFTDIQRDWLRGRRQESPKSLLDAFNKHFKTNVNVWALASAMRHIKAALGEGKKPAKEIGAPRRPYKKRGPYKKQNPFEVLQVPTKVTIIQCDANQLQTILRQIA